MKNKIKIGLILAVLSVALLATTACNAIGGGEGEVSQQIVQVVRGDLSISVTGSGSIETSHETRLAFGSSGKVDRILVEEGDRVSQGDVLATLDTSSLELARTQSEVGLTQAEVALTQAKLAQKTAEYNLKNTRETKDALELAVLNAQISLDSAKYNLDMTEDTYTWTDIKTAQADVDEAQRYLELCLEKLSEYLPADVAGDYPKILEFVLEEDYPKTPGYELWQERLIHAQSRLNTAKDTLDAMLSGSDTEEIAIKKKQVTAAEMSLAQAQKSLDDLAEDIEMQQLQVESAKQSVTQAEQSVELAKKSLDEAQRQLDEATVTAPFDGMVAQVLVKEGDNIPAPTMAPTPVVHLIDPDQMELIVEIDEIDIPLLELNQQAVISVDSLPGAEFKGTITSIHPVPKEVGGVVLYDVKLELDIPENSRIKVGMSASADIMIEERSNVLIVPSRAIDKDSQGQTIVKVMADKQVEERPVVVGLDDGLRAEIISGLQEGETVVIEVRVKTPSMSMF